MIDNKTAGFSLAGIGNNQQVIIRRVHYPELSDFCASLGLREGSVVRCRAASPWHLYLASADGRMVALERDRARFVEVVGQSEPAAANALQMSA